jgi:hypothetical protein
MGIALPQVVTSDRASGAQVIDGSLKFDGSNKTRIIKTFSSAGNRQSWTWSCWTKRDTLTRSDRQVIFGGYGASNNTDWLEIGWDSGADHVYFTTSGITADGTAQRRDPQGWYHFFSTYDGSTLKIYVNNRLDLSHSFTGDRGINVNGAHYIGQTPANSVDRYLYAKLSQCYFIDGQALGPESFGYTDGLTNTWRPKKYTGDFNVGSSSLTTQPAPYSAAARFSAYEEFGTVTNNDTGYTLPMSNPSHYGGKVRELDAGGFKVTTVNSATTDFFMGMWVKFETYSENEQFGIDLFGGYVYFETRANGAIGIRQSPGGRVDSSATSLNDGNWHHVALSRTGGTLYGFLDGSAVVNTTSGVSGDSVGANENFWFWGGSGTSYNIDGQVIDTFIYIGQGVSSYTTPTAPLIDASGNINHFSGFSDTQAYYISPGVDVSGSSPNPVPNYFVTGTNSFYLPMDGNSPIGEDKSGNGNNWTPVNFGGSNSLEKATGALPILNTDGGGRTARPGTRTDPYASSIVMAIPFLGNANDISADIKGSGSNLAVTTSGSPAADSDPVQWYGSSFNVSTNNHIDTIGTTSTFAFLHQPEVAGTIEGWINTNAVNVQGPWFQTSNGTNEIGVRFRQNSSTNLAVQIDRGTSGTYIVIDSSITIALNTWYHWAFVKSADGYAQFFLNGVPTGSKVPLSTAAGASNAAATNTSSSYAGRIAKNNGEARGIGANICDYRAYTVQKYAFDTSFIPASTNPDILPDTPSGVSGSSKLAKITDGAVYFDGTGDYCSTGSSSDFTMGTGDFTVECFIIKDDSSHRGIWQISSTSGGLQSTNYTQTLALGYQVNRWQLYAGGSAITGASPPTNGLVIPRKWYHLAVVRNSGTTKLYVDGREEMSTSDTYNYTGTYMAFGGYYNTSYLHYGNISNLRVLKGTALYTSNFTPPTRALTNVTNTKLLCCQSNTSPTAAAVTPGTITGPGTNYRFSTMKAYSVYNGGSRGANYTVQYSADGSNWSDAWTGNFSTSGCGLISGTGGGGDYGEHKYWRYQVGSSTDNHHPNIARIVLVTTGGTEIDIVTVTSDNCSDSGSFNSTTLGATYTNPNNPTATTFNPFTTDINAVRGQETGYPTFNPLINTHGLSNGNLTAYDTDNTWDTVPANISFNTGKYYAEFTVDVKGWNVFGVVQLDVSSTPNFYGTHPGGGAGNKGFGWVFDPSDSRGDLTYNNTNSLYTYGSGLSSSVGDVMSIAIDLDNNNIRFYKNGAQIYNLNNKLESGGRYTYSYGTYATAGATVNFGQKPFKFPPPDGFQPLNAANVRPETVIARPDQFVGATIWSGDASGSGGTTRFIETQHQPDFVWIKQRNQAFSTGHQLYDSVRGAGAEKELNSSSTAAEGAGNIETWGWVNSFDKTGFTTKGGPSGYDYVNNIGDDYVAWTWRAGGNKNTFNVDDVGYASASDVNMSVGALNSATYNTSQVWSDDVTKGTGNVYSNNIYVPANIFNGNTSSYCKVEKGSNSNTVSMQLSSTISGVTKIRVNTNSVDNFNINGGSNIASTDGYQTIYEGSAITLSDLDFTRTNGVSSGNSDTGFFVYSIEINGLELLDSGVTPSTNFPSIAATGASVGTKQGFSIVSYTSESGTGTLTATIPHGLNENIGFMIIKSRDFSPSSQGWAVWHQSSPTATRYLDSTEIFLNSEYTAFFDANPTNSVFSVKCSASVSSGNRYRTYGNSHNYIAYLWHDVPGLQKFGKFSANNSTDGNVIELGFRPTLVIAKQITGGGGNWFILDSKRNTSNPLNNILDANLADDERQAIIYDFLSTGFKLRIALTGDFIYCAWAEAPTFNLYGAQSNAR